MAVSMERWGIMAATVGSRGGRTDVLEVAEDQVDGLDHHLLRFLDTARHGWRNGDARAEKVLRRENVFFIVGV